MCLKLCLFSINFVFIKKLAFPMRKHCDTRTTINHFSTCFISFIKTIYYVLQLMMKYCNLVKNCTLSIKKQLKMCPVEKLFDIFRGRFL